MNADIATALMRRELSVRWLAPLAALLLAGVALGTHLARQPLPLPFGDPTAGIPAAPGSLGTFWLWILSRALPLPVAASATVLAIQRVADDNDSAWLATLAAGGLDRGGYIAALAAAIFLAHLGMYLALTAGLIVGTGLGPPAPDAATGTAIAASAASAASMEVRLGWMLRQLPGAAAMLASATVFGIACLAVTRRRGAAAALALAAVIAPFALAAWMGGERAPAAGILAIRALALLTPLADWNGSAATLLRHTTYTASLLLLLAWSAPRWVARHG